MLVLTRQPNEKVIIGEEVELQIVEVRGNKVRLGFLAPRYVTIHRAEVLQRIREDEAYRTARLIRNGFGFSKAG